MKDSQYYGIINACDNHSIPTQTAVNDITRIANELAISRCSHPKEHMITDRHTGIARRVFLPCGHCYHCTETYGNEWVTRMYHETQHFGENTCVYFVTLTYAGFKKYEYIPAFLLNAYWRKDALNSRHTLDYRPCLCRMEHLAYFVRNFRRFMHMKNESFDFSWVACCEYGHSFGAPHFHMILYTNTPIAFSDIMCAWSYNVGTRKHPRYKCIGRVDCVDIKNNGTMQGTKDKNAKKCFSYVAKYMYKMELPKKARLRLFYDDLKKGIPDYLLYTIFDARILKKKSLVQSWNDHVRKILENERDYEIYKSGADPATEIYHYSKPLYNYFHESVNLLALSQDSDDAQHLQRDALFALYFSDLVRLFRAQVRVSHSHAIGVKHMQRNVAEYSQNGLRINDAPFGKLVVPRYYEKCVANYFAPFESLSQTSSGGVSSARLVSPLQIEIYRKYIETGFASGVVHSLVHPDLLLLLPESLQRYERTFNPILHDDEWYYQKYVDYVSRITPEKILRSDYAIRDTRSSLRGYIGFAPDSCDILCVYWWLYDRSKRKYDLQAVEDFKMFAQGVIDCYDAYAHYKNLMIIHSEENYRKFVECNERVQDFFARINPLPETNPDEPCEIRLRPSLDSLIREIQDKNDIDRQLHEIGTQTEKEYLTKQTVLL